MVIRAAGRIPQRTATEPAPAAPGHAHTFTPSIMPAAGPGTRAHAKIGRKHVGS
jgi:hypothetical protein